MGGEAETSRTATCSNEGATIDTTLASSFGKVWHSQKRCSDTGWGLIDGGPPEEGTHRRIRDRRQRWTKNGCDLLELMRYLAFTVPDPSSLGLHDHTPNRRRPRESESGLPHARWIIWILRSQTAVCTSMHVRSMEMETTCGGETKTVGQGIVRERVRERELLQEWERAVVP